MKSALASLWGPDDTNPEEGRLEKSHTANNLIAISVDITNTRLDIQQPRVHTATPHISQLRLDLQSNDSQDELWEEKSISFFFAFARLFVWHRINLYCMNLGGI